MPIAYFPTGKYAFPPKSVPGLMTRVSACRGGFHSSGETQRDGFLQYGRLIGRAQVHELIARQDAANKNI